MNATLEYRNRAPAGMGIVLNLPKALPNKAYWLHARVTVPAYPKQEWLDEAADQTGKLFIADMAKQGWHYIDNGIWIGNEPIARTPITGAPSVLQRERLKASEALLRVQAGGRMRLQNDLSGYIAAVPDLSETAEWEYDLKAQFWRETVLVETPDPHEERKVLLAR